MSLKILAFFLLVNLPIFFYLFITNSYPKPLMVANFLSSAALWILALRFHPEKFKKEIIIAIGLFLATLIIGLFKIEELVPGMYGDEVTVGNYTVGTMNLDEAPPFFAEYSHPTPLLYLAGISVGIFGRRPLAVKFPSVLLGAVSVTTFFVLLRLFFANFHSLLGSILFLTSYTYVDLYRLGYEIPAAMLFFIFTAIFFKTKNWLGIGLALAGGLYTYLSFRPFFLVVGTFLFFYCFRKKLFWEFLIFAAAILISAGPILIFAANNPNPFLARSAEISVFGRYLPAEEVAKEIGGSFWRDITMFGITGNPNVEKNPARVPVFDGAVSLLALAGLVLLFRQNRRLFYFMILMAIPPLVSDVFSIEQIPEFHYYGLGHPNTPRLCQFIPWTYFLATYTLSKIRPVYLTIGATIIIAVFNLHWYFNQKQIAPGYYLYNWQVNKKTLLEMLDFINQNSLSPISLDPAIAGSEQRRFFLDPKIQIATDSAIKAFLIDKKNFEEISRLATQSGVKTITFNNPAGYTEGAILIKQ